MPRRYKCRKCGVEHAPPTGKHCRQAVPEAEENNAENNTEMMGMLVELKNQMGSMQREMAQMRLSRESSEAGDRLEEESSDSESKQSEGEQPEDEDRIDPKTLRKDFKIMAKAARRLATFDSDDDLALDSEELPRARGRGRKSGSTMTPSDVVKKSIDWPHMHVRRMNAGRKRNVAYDDLKVEEFVYGFLTMLEKPDNKLDITIMIRILRMLMLDTIDFSWSNSLNYYLMLGLDVEHGYIKWTDTELIREMRMTYARTNFPEKRELKEAVKSGPKAAPSGMRCCIAFQSRSCDQNRDHHPFTHACSHCHKASSVLARHPEDDCFKKLAMDTKNGKKREQ